LSIDEFSRMFVHASQPCVLLRAVDDWAACRDWQDSAGFFGDGAAGEEVVTLASTPDGCADASDECIAGGALRLPFQQRVTLRAAVAALLSPTSCGVAYLSSQNNSLRREVPILAAATLGGHGALRISRAFGAIEAENIWASGFHTATSHWHRDHYDNLHTVITGKKTFLLLPPSGVLALRKRPVDVQRWRHDSSRCWRLHPEPEDAAPGERGECWRLGPAPDALPPGETSVPWIATAPRAAEKWGEEAVMRPLRAELSAGETLFLPALWYHEVVSHSSADWLTIAVNTWFEAPALGAAANSASFFEELALQSHDDI
jgi:jumonji domain-containing protein 7